MIVDDDQEFLEELSETLRLSEYEVIPVNDPVYAVDTVISKRPDLVLLDLKMPDESGFQIACELKYFQGLRNIPTIAMTAFFKEGYLALMKTYGIQDYLKKPFNELDVISKIESLT